MSETTPRSAEFASSFANHGQASSSLGSKITSVFGRRKAAVTPPTATAPPAPMSDREREYHESNQWGR